MLYPNFTKRFIVHYNASEKVLGVALHQETDGKMKTTSYTSQTLTPAEKNYHLHS